MIFFLIFLLSWLCGMLTILTSGFFFYDSFTTIDITFFTLFLLAGSIILIPLIYLPILKWINKRIVRQQQLLLFPLLLALAANLPLYFVVWSCTDKFYGRSESFLFYFAFIIIAIVFGQSWAWKNKHS